MCQCLNISYKNQVFAKFSLLKDREKFFEKYTKYCFELFIGNVRLKTLCPTLTRKIYNFSLYQFCHLLKSKLSRNSLRISVRSIAFFNTKSILCCSTFVINLTIGTQNDYLDFKSFIVYNIGVIHADDTVNMFYNEYLILVQNFDVLAYYYYLFF